MASDLLLLLALIVFNGVFAMSEIAVVSARRARLERMAADGSAGAARALALSAEPTRFLSTVQVGITSIGILSGAIGESAIADRLRVVFEGVPLLQPYAQGLALGTMVLVLTYVSLIVGELVPKRLGLTHPERIAALVAGPMSALATIGRPLVLLLTQSTEAVLAMLRVPKNSQSVSVEEVKGLMKQGTEEGVFEPAAQDLVANVLNLDERTAGAIVTPRSDIVFLDALLPFEQNRARLEDSPHAVMPLCRGGLDDVVGFVRSSDILARVLRNEQVDLLALARAPLFVPHTLSLMDLLQHFRQTHLPVALVVDEFGVVDGLVSLTDVTAAIVGDLRETGDGDDSAVVRRDDGSWLIDGSVDLARLEQVVGSRLIDDEEDDRRQYHTAGGFAMAVLARVPNVGDTFERAGFRFEVVDMDGNRVDRLLVAGEASAHT